MNEQEKTMVEVTEEEPRKVWAFCSYCGHQRGEELPVDEANRYFADHILSCPKHPLAAQVRVNMVLRYAAGILAKKLKGLLDEIYGDRSWENAGAKDNTLDTWQGDGIGPVAVTLGDVEQMLAVEKWSEQDDQFYSHLGARLYRLDADRAFEECEKAMREKGFLKEEGS